MTENWNIGRGLLTEVLGEAVGTSSVGPGLGLAVLPVICGDDTDDLVSRLVANALRKAPVSNPSAGELHLLCVGEQTRTGAVLDATDPAGSPAVLARCTINGGGDCCFCMKPCTATLTLLVGSVRRPVAISD